MNIKQLLDPINQHIINPLILLIFAVAFGIFFWGIVQFIAKETTDSGREEGKKKIFWGLFGMFIMISAYGLIRLILNTFNIPNTGDYLPL